MRWAWPWGLGGRRWAPLLWWCWLGACAAPMPGGSATGQWYGEAWPEADALFRSDPDWLGGDGAHSVALPAGRTLWLFGDSFVARRPDARTRREATMVRNSVAVMVGSDPSQAAMAFHYRRDADGGPASFFPERDDGAWYWPADGLYLEDTLTVVLQRIVAAPDAALGFAIDGYELHRADAPALSAAPTGWAFRALPATAQPPSQFLGVTLVAEGDHIYLFGVRESARHEVVLARWPRAAFLSETPGPPAAWNGATWGDARAEAIITEGATEFSVGHIPGQPGFALVFSRGFGATRIAMRSATALTGPYSAPVDLYSPPESRSQRPFVYAGKAHDHLTGAAWVATYAANDFDFATLLESPALYFPRFVRLNRR